MTRHNHDDDLAAIEVQVFVASLDQPSSLAAELVNLCDSTERASAGRMRRESLRHDRLLARGFLRTALGHHLGVSPRALALERRTGSPPRLAAASGPADVAFSMSHSGRLVAVAIGRGAELGIDVERVDPSLDVDAVARRAFTPDEQRELDGAGPAERCAVFFRIWTRKEAYLKARGTGWSLTPDQHPDLSSSLSHGGGRVTTIAVAPGHAAAVATLPHAARDGVRAGHATPIHLTMIGVP